MPFIERVKNYRSISTVGLEKNVGKTETLNYVLKKLNEEGYRVALTSIGIDGETVDQVTFTKKPEIYLQKNSVFVTSEKHYKMKRFLSEVISVSQRTTSLGRLVTARVISPGYIMLSGPTSNAWVKNVIENTLSKGIDIVIVDGALSRLSVGSPAITEGIILSTGAAVSLNAKEVIKRTGHVIDLIKLEEVDSKEKEILKDLEDGVYVIKDTLEKLPIKSLLQFDKIEKNIFDLDAKIYITGIITDRFLDYASNQIKQNIIEIVVQDFTKIFVSSEIVKKFRRKGGILKVLKGTELIAITVNPVAPNGQKLDSQELIEGIKEFTEVPVVNLREV